MVDCKITEQSKDTFVSGDAQGFTTRAQQDVNDARNIALKIGTDCDVKSVRNVDKLVIIMK